MCIHEVKYFAFCLAYLNLICMTLSTFMDTYNSIYNHDESGKARSWGLVTVTDESNDLYVNDQ